MHLYQVTLQTVHEAEDEVTILKIKVDDARRDLQLVRLQMREEQKVVSHEICLCSNYNGGGPCRSCTVFSAIQIDYDLISKY